MDAEEASPIGWALWRVRDERGQSLRVVAGLAGMGKDTLNRIETGRRSPTVSELQALADALQISVSELTRLPVPAPANGHAGSPRSPPSCPRGMSLRRDTGRPSPPGSRRPTGPHPMSAPAMWWGPATDGRLHAVAPCDITPAADRCFTESLCGWQLPVGVALLSQPDDAAVCPACHLGATTDLDSSTLPALAPFGQPGKKP